MAATRIVSIDLTHLVEAALRGDPADSAEAHEEISLVRQQNASIGVASALLGSEKESHGRDHDPLPAR